MRRFILLLFLCLLTGCNSFFGPSEKEQRLDYNSQVISSDFYFQEYLNDPVKWSTEITNWETGNASDAIVDWLHNEKKSLNDPTIDPRAYSQGLDLVYKRIKGRESSAN